MDENVDILKPPLFEKSGKIKLREQAYNDGDWITTFNLWVVQRRPRPAIVYQIRGPHEAWGPNKLDVAVGGRYRAGESLKDGLREAKEELGKDYDPDKLVYLGRKLYVGLETSGRERHEVIEIYLVEDNEPLNSYRPDQGAVHAICSLPLDELLKTHTDKSYRFTTQALKSDGSQQTITVSADSFPENYDNYHFKIALLVQRFLAGEKHLIY